MTEPFDTTVRFDIEERWPDLFAPLDATQRRAVVQSLAAAWHEGWVPNRDDVQDLAEEASGAITFEEYQLRSIARAESVAKAAANQPRRTATG